MLPLPNDETAHWSVRRRAVEAAENLPGDLHPVLRRVYAARGVREGAALSLNLRQLLPPDGLLDLDRAAALLAGAVRAGRRIVLCGDYDADGATSTALAVSMLRAFGHPNVGYVVPDRFRMGYGLSPALVERARDGGAEVLLTVDNGIASIEGVAAAKAAGLDVIVTDHHLPGEVLPQADAIVNPNRPGDGFASKQLAGVGVVFYVMAALRKRLREEGWFAGRAEPNMAEALDLVALGTVADLVRLDYNNRVLVAVGLERIRSGRARPGIMALLAVAGRDARRIQSSDLGFVLGPRINAAGRLDDMGQGIELLLSADPGEAARRAQQLDALNRERRAIERSMVEDAELIVADAGRDAVGVCVFDPDWHEGVVGLVASRMKERLHRPVVAFAPAQEDGWLKGSARSISGLHLRDALAAVDACHPGLIARFGGHAMAAGLSLRAASLDAFAAAFDAQCRALLEPAALERVLLTDGSLSGRELGLETALALEGAGPWGQGFPEPSFDGRFVVESVRAVAERHARYRLLAEHGQVYSAIHFNGFEQCARAGDTVELVYRLSVNRWQDSENAELVVERLLPATQAPRPLSP